MLHFFIHSYFLTLLIYLLITIIYFANLIKLTYSLLFKLKTATLNFFFVSLVLFIIYAPIYYNENLIVVNYCMSKTCYTKNL
jgi:hypothetical protein